MLSFVLVNGREVKASHGEVQFFISTFLAANPYWRSNNMLSKEEVLRFLDGKADEKLLDRIAYYILFYAENICFSAYLHVKAAEGKQRAVEYMQQHKNFLEKLRLMKKTVNGLKKEAKYKMIHKMINLCLEYAIDPF